MIGGKIWSRERKEEKVFEVTLVGSGHVTCSAVRGTETELVLVSRGISVRCSAVGGTECLESRGILAKVRVELWRTGRKSGLE